MCIHAPALYVVSLLTITTSLFPGDCLLTYLEGIPVCTWALIFFTSDAVAIISIDVEECMHLSSSMLVYNDREFSR